MNFSDFGETVLNKQQIKDLSIIISEKWSKLARRLDVPKETIETLKQNPVVSFFVVVW